MAKNEQTPATEVAVVDYTTFDFSKINLAKIEATIIKDSHPAANIFPMMSAEEFASLVVSMEQSGFDKDKPVLKNADGKIVDGRNRLKAANYVNEKVALWNEAHPDAKRPEIKVAYDTAKGDDPQLLEEVLRDNFTRRNMSSSQKAAVAVKAGLLADGYAKKKAFADEGKKTKGHVAEIIAAQSGTNHVYIYKAKMLAQKGRTDLLNAVIAGEMKLMEAYKLMEDAGDGTPDEDKAKDGEIADGLGNRVDNKEHQALFVDAAEWKAAATTLRDAKAILQTLMAKASGALLAERSNEMTDAFKALGRLIRDTQPHIVCPHCDGKGTEPNHKKEVCKLCKGATFISKTTYDRFVKDGAASFDTPADDVPPVDSSKGRKRTKSEAPKASEAPSETTEAHGEPTGQPE